MKKSNQTSSQIWVLILALSNWTCTSLSITRNMGPSLGTKSSLDITQWLPTVFQLWIKYFRFEERDLSYFIIFDAHHIVLINSCLNMVISMLKKFLHYALMKTFTHRAIIEIKLNLSQDVPIQDRKLCLYDTWNFKFHNAKILHY